MAKLNDNERKSYLLAGHTNSLGNIEVNRKLSILRSMHTLELFLNNFELDLYKMPAIGEGETNPLNDNETVEERKRKSGVELRKMK